MRLWLLVHNLRAKVPMKFNAPDDFFFKMTEHIWSSLDNAFTKEFFFRFSLPRFCWLIMMTHKILIFPNKFPLDGNEM